MDVRQKKLEKKRLKREKIRREHLEAAKRTREGEAIKEYEEEQDSGSAMPHKDDSLGWSRYNALGAKNVIAKAQEMFPNRREWKKILFKKSMSNFECREASSMLTEAARALVWDFPYFTPLVLVEMHPGGIYGYTIKVYPMTMEKESIPAFGSIWHSEMYRSNDIVWHNRKSHLMCWSRHALDRMKERLEFFETRKSVLIKIFNSILPLNPIKCEDGFLAPMVMTANGKSGILVGYCPFEIYEHRAIAKSFLLPFMRGTPEHEVLKRGRMSHTLREVVSMQDYEGMFADSITALSGLSEYQLDIIKVEGTDAPWLSQVAIKTSDDKNKMFKYLEESYWSIGRRIEKPKEELLDKPISSVICEGLQEALAC